MLKRENASEASAAPKTRVIVPDRDQERELLKITTRMALVTYARVRTLMSLVYNARFRTDSEVIKAIKQTTDDYIASQAKLKTEGKTNEMIQVELGPLHVHLWNTLVLKTAEYYKDKEEATIIAAYQSRVKTYHDFVNEIKVCKKGNMHDSKFKKIELFVVADQTKTQTEEKGDAEKIVPFVIKYFATQSGFRQLPGTPPPGDLARRAQAILDEMDK